MSRRKSTGSIAGALVLGIKVEWKRPCDRAFLIFGRELVWIEHVSRIMICPVQRLLYSGMIAAGIVAVLTGLAIWKPVQFQVLTNFFGDFDRARIIHFLAMCAIFLFLILLVVALAVPKSLRAMILGR